MILTPDLLQARALPLKLQVDATGIYEVSYDELQLTAPIPSAELKLSHRDSEVAISVIDDGGDDHFGPGDSLRFYGQAIARSDPLYRYTGRAVYRLDDTAVNGLRMASSPMSTCSCPVSSDFHETLPFELYLL